MELLQVSLILAQFLTFIYCCCFTTLVFCYLVILPGVATATVSPVLVAIFSGVGGKNNRIYTPHMTQDCSRVSIAHAGQLIIDIF